jgi:menaquinone-dependent protoporphyrinogen oxidase
MPKKVLVVYATRSGTTQQIAESVGALLDKAGFNAEVHRVNEAGSLDGYDAVVVGTAVRAGRLMAEAVRFVRKNREKLGTLPVAAFAVCLTAKDDTPENRKAVEAYLAPLRKEIPLVSEAVLAGAIHYARLGVFARFVIQKMVKAPEGDFRDAEKIAEWTRDLGNRFRSSGS